MKEAFGSTFMIYILLIFLAVYITFVAVALNYAKAFRVKNSIIDIIEQNEGVDLDDNGGTIRKIDTRLKEYSYNVRGIEEDKYITAGTGKCYDLGYCITKVSDDIKGKYYKVITFVHLEIPFMDLGFTIPIRGETRVIERINA